MTPITLPCATVEQALEAMRCAVPTGKITLYEWDKAMAALRAALAQQRLTDAQQEMERSIESLKAALAQQAEPDHETRAELAEQQVVQLAEERDHYRNLWQKAQQAEPVAADALTEPKSGDKWRVEWWNESCRMMLPAHAKLDSFVAYKNGTIQFTIKRTAA